MGGNIVTVTQAGVTSTNAPPKAPSPPPTPTTISISPAQLARTNLLRSEEGLAALGAGGSQNIGASQVQTVKPTQSEPVSKLPFESPTSLSVPNVNAPTLGISLSPTLSIDTKISSDANTITPVFPSVATLGKAIDISAAELAITDLTRSKLGLPPLEKIANVNIVPSTGESGFIAAPPNPFQSVLDYIGTIANNRNYVGINVYDTNRNVVETVKPNQEGYNTIVGILTDNPDFTFGAVINPSLPQNAKAVAQQIDSQNVITAISAIKTPSALVEGSPQQLEIAKTATGALDTSLETLPVGVGTTGGPYAGALGAALANPKEGFQYPTGRIGQTSFGAQQENIASLGTSLTKDTIDIRQPVITTPSVLGGLQTLTAPKAVATPTVTIPSIEISASQLANTNKLRAEDNLPPLTNYKIIQVTQSEPLPAATIISSGPSLLGNALNISPQELATTNAQRAKQGLPPLETTIAVNVGYNKPSTVLPSVSTFVSSIPVVNVPDVKVAPQLQNTVDFFNTVRIDPNYSAINILDQNNQVVGSVPANQQGFNQFVKLLATGKSFSLAAIVNPAIITGQQALETQAKAANAKQLSDVSTFINNINSNQFPSVNVIGPDKKIIANVKPDQTGIDTIDKLLASGQTFTLATVVNPAYISPIEQADINKQSSDAISQAQAANAKSINIEDQNKNILDTIPLKDAPLTLPLAIGTFVGQGKVVNLSIASDNVVPSFKGPTLGSNAAALAEFTNPTNSFIRITNINTGNLVTEVGALGQFLNELPSNIAASIEKGTLTPLIPKLPTEHSTAVEGGVNILSSDVINPQILTLAGATKVGQEIASNPLGTLAANLGNIETGLIPVGEIGAGIRTVVNVGKAIKTGVPISQAGLIPAVKFTAKYLPDILKPVDEIKLISTQEAKLADVQAKIDETQNQIDNILVTSPAERLTGIVTETRGSIASKLSSLQATKTSLQSQLDQLTTETNSIKQLAQEQLASGGGALHGVDVIPTIQKISKISDNTYSLEFNDANSKYLGGLVTFGKDEAGTFVPILKSVEGAATPYNAEILNGVRNIVQQDLAKFSSLSSKAVQPTELIRTYGETGPNVQLPSTTTLGSATEQTSLKEGPVLLQQIADDVNAFLKNQGENFEVTYPKDTNDVQAIFSSGTDNFETVDRIAKSLVPKPTAIAIGKEITFTNLKQLSDVLDQNPQALSKELLGLTKTNLIDAAKTGDITFLKNNLKTVVDDLNNLKKPISPEDVFTKLKEETGTKSKAFTQVRPQGFNYLSNRFNQIENVVINALKKPTKPFEPTPEPKTGAGGASGAARARALKEASIARKDKQIVQQIFKEKDLTKPLTKSETEALLRDIGRRYVNEPAPNVTLDRIASDLGLKNTVAALKLERKKAQSIQATEGGQEIIAFPPTANLPAGLKSTTVTGLQQLNKIRNLPQTKQTQPTALKEVKRNILIPEIDLTKILKNVGEVPKLKREPVQKRKTGKGIVQIYPPSTDLITIPVIGTTPIQTTKAGQELEVKLVVPQIYPPPPITTTVPPPPVEIPSGSIPPYIPLGYTGAEPKRKGRARSEVFIYNVNPNLVGAIAAEGLPEKFSTFNPIALKKYEERLGKASINAKKGFHGLIEGNEIKLPDMGSSKKGKLKGRKKGKYIDF